ncbi:hypothetical protein G4Z16_31890 [Streptomyces bathyalis]|uniref:Uncharacterized protein n=1 Tax=Streptomyces bathyalis TaxID=2710756 RepID=A0A7T1WTH8_9ACTN|nr:hypothetical protein [Streptomyces bathyalis]QPP10268.1 hypothetical protein G4Z16_31890 [Streptomyces bathyalis]
MANVLNTTSRHVERLFLPPTARGLTDIHHWPGLKHLGLRPLETGPGIADWQAIAEHPGLESFNLRASNFEDLMACQAGMERCRVLYLLIDGDDIDLHRVARCSRRYTTLP